MEARQALMRLPDPDPSGEERILRRFARSRAGQRGRPWMGSRGFAFGALVLAAAAFAAVLWPSPPRTVVLSASPAAPEPLRWSRHVELTAAGSGEVTGTHRDLRVRWQSGRLGLRVADQPVTLAVEADEGRIEGAGGAAFDVVRDALGLTTTVERGEVRVICADGSEVAALAPSTGSITCWPRSPARLLGRADALEERGAPLDEVRATLDRALSAIHDPDDVVRGELLARRMHVLAAAGLSDAALDDANDYLGHFATRTPEVRRFAVEQAIEQRDCGRALPHLLELTDEPDHRWLLATCLRRLAAHEEALVDGEVDAEHGPPSERARGWLERLGGP